MVYRCKRDSSKS